MKVYVLCDQYRSSRSDRLYVAVFNSKAVALRYCENMLKVDVETWEPYINGREVA